MSEQGERDSRLCHDAEAKVKGELEPLLRKACKLLMSNSIAMPSLLQGWYNRRVMLDKLEARDEEIRAENRKYQEELATEREAIKARAASKLTDEEKRALGL